MALAAWAAAEDTGPAEWDLVATMLGAWDPEWAVAGGIAAMVWVQACTRARAADAAMARWEAEAWAGVVGMVGPAWVLATVWGSVRGPT
jgi:hypothetical protein